jgi:hypothetical protein
MGVLVYCSVPATLANALRRWLLEDRTRGAWPQSWRARCGTTRCIVSVCCCGVVVSKKVEMGRGGLESPQLSPRGITWRFALSCLRE